MKQLISVLFALVMFFSFSSNAQGALIDSGDINFDGVVNIQDAVMLQKHILGIKLLEGDELERAEMNLDGAINVQDLVYLIKIRILEISDPGI